MLKKVLKILKNLRRNKKTLFLLYGGIMLPLNKFVYKKEFFL
jgi:hypothetical protein